MGRDITEMMRTQESLTRSLARLKDYEAIVNRSTVVVFLWRCAEGWPVEFVSENVDQFGYTAEDLRSGRVSWVGIIHPDDMVRLDAELAQMEAERRDEFTQQYRLFTRDGDIRWIEDRTIVLRD